MNTERFNILLKHWEERIKNTLEKKGKEYSSEEDKLLNFKQGATISGNTPETVLWNYMLKHYISLTGIIKELENEGNEPNYDVFIEKTSDIVNYLILLDALICERRENRPLPF